MGLDDGEWIRDEAADPAGEPDDSWPDDEWPDDSGPDDSGPDATPPGDEVSAQITGTASHLTATAIQDPAGNSSMS
jgi:hypothetical protein